MYYKLLTTVFIGLTSFMACAQTTRADLIDRVGTRPQTACTAKITSLLSFADKTRLEYNSGAAKTEMAAKQVGLLCTQDGILESIRSLDGSTLRIYQSSYYNGGVVLSFVDTNGKHLDMLPFNQRELGELGLTIAALDRVIPFAPEGLAQGLVYRQPTDNARSNAKIFFDTQSDCRTVCDGVRDAEMDYCSSASSEDAKLNCRVKAWHNWGNCTSSLSDLKGIGCKMIWTVHISPVFGAKGTTICLKTVKICPRPDHFSHRFFKSDRLLGNAENEWQIFS